MRRFSLLLALSFLAACAPPPAGTGAGGTAGAVFPFDWEVRGLDPIGTGTQGMVATTDVRATRVGIDILEAGGNAVDAAIAVGFALAVVHPAAGNIGGGNAQHIDLLEDTQFFNLILKILGRNLIDSLTKVGFQFICLRGFVKRSRIQQFI